MMNKNGYRHLIFDIDDTLLDFGSAFFLARENVATFLGVECSEEYKALDEKTGWKAWNEMRLDSTEEEDVQKHYHEYYYEYLRRHFKYLLEELGMKEDEEALVDCYLEAIASSASLKEAGTLDVIRKLSENYVIELASNGIVKTQMKRIKIFEPFVRKTYISEDIGAIKPTEDFFKYILRDLQCNPGECLMIGDSIMNDVIGAKKAGMATCYYNPRNKEVRSDCCDYVIDCIQKLLQIL
ncbi:MAG: HAD family hydrolase [Lachnospiraceae bacterium]|nr:HAD family hydrolase [Lachnospiraceae bacterium]